MKTIMLEDFPELLPGQDEGVEISATATEELANEEVAKKCYTRAKELLRDVNNWQQLSGWASAAFALHDMHGNEKKGSLEKMDLLRIDIPGPGSSYGKGFDWVLVEQVIELMDEETAKYGFRVRPTQRPGDNSGNIAHFYNPVSTSSFFVKRSKNFITVSIVDRNVKPNDDTQSITDKLRNLPVAMGGIALFSKIQWQQLTENILKKSLQLVQ